MPQRGERDRVTVPEATARSADVPVGDVIDEVLVRTHDVDGQPALVAGGRIGDGPARPLDEPAIERLEFPVRPAREVAPRRGPARDVRVVDEESARVPEGEQLPLDLVGGTEAEEEVLVRRLRAVLPAHDVRAHARE